jgi:exodeoxyribonuclease-5
VRKHLGYHDHALKVGEPLLVLMNNYALDRFNGEVLRFEGWKQTPDELVAVRDRWKNVSLMMSFGIANIEGGLSAILSQEEVFGQTAGLSESVISRNAKDYAVNRWGFDRKFSPSYLNANLGYCLTCHKAQGSEWDDVVVVAEKTIGGRAGLYGYEGRRFLYTAVTRAKKRVVIAFQT